MSLIRYTCYIAISVPGHPSVNTLKGFAETEALALGWVEEAPAGETRYYEEIFILEVVP